MHWRSVLANREYFCVAQIAADQRREKCCRNMTARNSSLTLLTYSANSQTCLCSTRSKTQSSSVSIVLSIKFHFLRHAFTKLYAPHQHQNAFFLCSRLAGIQRFLTLVFFQVIQPAWYQSHFPASPLSALPPSH